MNKKLLMKGLFIAVLSVIIATIFGSSASYAEAVITRGLYTDSNDVRWEWQKTINEENTEEPEQVSIMFYDKPAAATTIVVPSLSDVITAASASESLNTYYVRSADLESQATNFTEAGQEKRTSTADVTKLDMTNTSKVQIMGVKPIINPETEVELVFGENMVIGDGEGSLEASINPRITVNYCATFEEAIDFYGDKYYRCTNFEEREFSNFTDNIMERSYNYSTGNWETRYWADYSEFEKKSYQPKVEDIGCKDYYEYYQSGFGGIYSSYVSECMVDWQTAKLTIEQNVATGVFANYKLKLTNLENVKYLGWYAFQNATFNESSRAITIEAHQTAGEGVFASTNVNSVSVSGTEIFPRMFANCNDLSVENIHFGNAETISYGAFENAKLNGALDLSSTKVKNILSFAFKGAGLSSINIDGVEKLDYEAFANNNLTELYLPKSLKDMNTGRIFAGNKNITKLTVAYDMMQRGMMTPLHYAIGEYIAKQEDCVASRITDLTVIAPYDANEEVDRERAPYSEFVSSRELSGYYVNFGDDSNEFGHADTYKNIIAPAGFAWFTGLENITIGDGYDFIGANAFYSYLHGKYRFGPVGYHFNNVLDYVTYHDLIDDVFHVSLPEGLKGIGGNAFASHPLGDFEINLPESLEYIGGHAFVNDVFMRNDVDLPNLRYIGFQAFYISGVHDVYLHDKLEYVGAVPFMGCWNLNDITFDFDVFSTSALSYGTGTWGSAMFEHPLVTWSSFGDELSRGLYGEDRIVQSSVNWDQFTIKRGNIVFTEKAVTAPNTTTNWFYMTAAKTVDMSKTPWTVIPPCAFLGSSIDTLLLPEHAEFIGDLAFLNARIRDELVLPDTVKSIGGNAFSNWQYIASGGPYYEDGRLRYYYIDENNNYYIDDELIGKVTNGISGAYTRGVKITKLPSSLESVGYMAFYGDDLLSADLNSPNLQSIGAGAFMGTRLKDITLGSKIESIGISAFQGIPTMEDIVIDCDYGVAGKKSEGVILTDIFDVSWSYSEAVKKLEHGIIAKSITFTENAVTDFPEAQIIAMEECEFGEYSNDYCWNEGREYSITRYPISPETYYPLSSFYNATIDTIDLSRANWTMIPKGMFNKVKASTIKLPTGITEISNQAFYEVQNVGGSEEDFVTVEVPSSIQTVGVEAFEYSKVKLQGQGDGDTFAEGLIDIKGSAFYGADVHGDIVIPSSVQHIGFSAFNAGDADTHYGTVTIKPSLDYIVTDNQAVFQLFWNAKMDKLVVDSPMLPVLRASMEDDPILPETLYNAADDITIPGFELREDGEPEFHGMTMREVEINGIYAITPNAFEECANLEKVVFSNNQYLDRIGKYAFNNATKLKQVIFGEANNNKDINLHEYAFNNTAIESLGITNDSGMNLAAANFRTADEHVFSNMPKLQSVSIPSNFNIDESLANAEKNTNGSYITSFTFADDPELAEVAIDYQVSEIRDGAFLNDEKLSKLFVWGNAEIQESDDLIRDFNNTTIPKGTTIFAYSDAPAEAYANAESRNNYDGKFYALDEVLYLTSNKSKVLLEQDEEGNNTGFDKTGLKLYGLRRDGVILESDWQNYNTAFKRTETPEGTNISFEEGRGALGPDDAAIAATVFDAPKPFNAISLANENFANVDYEFVAIASNNNPLIVVHYPDGYTGNIRNTTLISTTVQEIIEDITDPEPEEELEVPDTGSYGALIGAATSSVSIATIIVLGGIFIAKRRKN